MSEKPEDATNIPPAAEPAHAAQPPPVHPAPAPAPRTGFLHSTALQLVLVGLAGLLLGCLVGGCVVAALASHHGGGYSRYDDDRWHDRRDDWRDWGPGWGPQPPERQYPRQPNLPPPVVPPPNQPVPNQPTPIQPTPRVS